MYRERRYSHSTRAGIYSQVTKRQELALLSASASKSEPKGGGKRGEGCTHHTDSVFPLDGS